MAGAEHAVFEEEHDNTGAREGHQWHSSSSSRLVLTHVEQSLVMAEQLYRRAGMSEHGKQFVEHSMTRQQHTHTHTNYSRRAQQFNWIS